MSRAGRPSYKTDQWQGRHWRDTLLGGRPSPAAMQLMLEAGEMADMRARANLKRAQVR